MTDTQQDEEEENWLLTRDMKIAIGVLWVFFTLSAATRSGVTNPASLAGASFGVLIPAVLLAALAKAIGEQISRLRGAIGG